jgi:hypothetical protein
VPRAGGAVVSGRRYPQCGRYGRAMLTPDDERWLTAMRLKHASCYWADCEKRRLLDILVALPNRDPVPSQRAGNTADATAPTPAAAPAKSDSFGSDPLR